jgi:hypothetical protein
MDLRTYIPSDVYSGLVQRDWDDLIAKSFERQSKVADADMRREFLSIIKDRFELWGGSTFEFKVRKSFDFSMVLSRGGRGSLTFFFFSVFLSVPLRFFFVLNDPCRPRLRMTAGSCRAASCT